MWCDPQELATATVEELREWRDAATPIDEKTLMQVKLTIKGPWHEMRIDRQRTKCGKALGGYATRDASYLGLLCEEGCFSRHELDHARELNEAAAARAEEQRRLEDLEDLRLSDELYQRRLAKNRDVDDDDS